MLRTLYRDRFYAFINVAGLSLAMASCLVLGSYLLTELTYDHQNVNRDRIYRVATQFTANGRTERVATSSPELAPLLKENFADVRAYVRFRTAEGDWEFGTDRLIRHGQDAFYWRDIYTVDDNVFEVFTHHILFGNPKTALVDPSSAAVSRTFAQKYFGSTNPVGQVVTLDNGEQKTITLVFDDLPQNAHLRYDVLFSYNGVAIPKDDVERSHELFAASDFTYLVMPEHYDARKFATIADTFFARYMADRASEIHVDGWKAWLQPLTAVHLSTGLNLDRPTGNPTYLLGLEAAVAFILLVACINHVNLATASAVRRAKEIGTRKILGASRRALLLQLVGESMVLMLAGVLVSFGWVKFLVPLTPIESWLGQSAAPALTVGVIAAMSVFGLAIGALSGLYPAFYLSAVGPLAGLSTGSAPSGSAKSRLRELLVLVQLTATVCVIACTLLMASQLRYVATRPLGFEQHGRLLIPLRGTDVLEQIQTIEQELAANEHVLGATSGDAVLGQELPAGFMDVETNDGAMNGVIVHHLPVQQNFVKVLGLTIVAGRDLSPDVATDRNKAFIVNEALVRLMGWRNPIGKRMGLRGRTVIGVVRDFNFKSLHTPVEPIVLYEGRSNFSAIPPDLRPFKQQFLVLDVAADDLGGTLDFIRETLHRFDAVHPFEYRFLDDALGDQYVAEQRLMRLIGTFSGICIFVACLGLFGLATFTTARRTKEIGIRKVLGASTSQIVALLSRRMVLLVLAGGSVGSLLAYAAMTKWLTGFAYRVAVGPMAFVAAAAIVLVVALLTISAQSLKSARARPVDSLRAE
jgi:putative ABC transport system permease protein